MNKYLKSFLLRGLAFGGFGPIVVGIVYVIIERSLSDFSLDADAVFIAIVSTYLLAFVQAGASVFNQIEEWSVPKSLFFHFSTLYITYVLCYLLNTWIPFRAEVILIFTAIFVVSYLVIWCIVYFAVRSVSKKMNERLSRQ